MNRKPESVQHSNYFLSTTGEWDTILYIYIQTCYHSCTVSTSSTLTFQNMETVGDVGQKGIWEEEKTEQKDCCPFVCFWQQRDIVRKIVKEGGRDTEGQIDTITIHMLGRRSPFQSH